MATRWQQFRSVHEPLGWQRPLSRSHLEGKGQGEVPEDFGSLLAWYLSRIRAPESGPPSTALM